MQSWEAGARVFDRELLDADWALNNGNWMWLSASAFFHQYFRVYGPVRTQPIPNHYPKLRIGFRVGERSRGRFTTPTDFPRHDCIACPPHFTCVDPLAVAIREAASWSSMGRRRVNQTHAPKCRGARRTRARPLSTHPR
jgi:hypothetical protein